MRLLCREQTQGRMDCTQDIDVYYGAIATGEPNQQHLQQREHCDQWFWLAQWSIDEVFAWRDIQINSTIG